MKNRSVIRCVVLAVLGIPSIALAHPGHGVESGFAAGFTHPFEASDHLFALIAVGVLAARLGRNAVLMGTAVLSLLALGLAAGSLGIELRTAGPIAAIATGLCALLIIMRPSRLIGAIVTLAAGLAFFSGMAHGDWIAPDVTGLGFALGFIAASATVMLVGALATSSIHGLVTGRSAGSSSRS
jgi:urease accessory protein